MQRTKSILILAVILSLSACASGLTPDEIAARKAHATEQQKTECASIGATSGRDMMDCMLRLKEIAAANDRQRQANRNAQAATNAANYQAYQTGLRGY